MPNDPGPSSWGEAQYRKFLDGVQQTGDPNAPRIARSQVPVRVEPGKNPQITIPGWSDIIRTGPRTIVTEEDWRTQRHFEKAGLPSPLGADVQDAIRERRELARRIANSAIPEYQRGVSTMLTAVDNVQDAALSVAVGARITGAALGRFGRWMFPATIAFGRIASALNWLGLAIFAFGVLYALACQGPRAAFAQANTKALAGYLFKGVRQVLPRQRGVPVATPLPEMKGRIGSAMYGVPAGRFTIQRGTTRWARMKPGFGELLQIGQVAYDVTGYGVALGGVMGLIAETTYSTTRVEQGVSVKLRSPTVNHLFDGMMGQRSHGLGRAAAWHREQCCRALAAAPLILRDPETFGDATYGLAWIVVYTSVEPLMWDTQGLAWREPIISRALAEWTPWEVRDLITRGTLEELGIDPDLDPRWPLPRAPRVLDTTTLVETVGKEISDGLRRWLEQEPMDPWRRFIAELSMRTCERLWYWLEGGAHFPRFELAPPTAVWESLIRASRWPIVSDPPDKILAAWAASERYIIETGVKYIEEDELDRIWTEAGSPLLRLIPGPAVPGAEHFAAYDPDTGDPSGVAFGQNVTEARRRLTELLQDQPPGATQS